MIRVSIPFSLPFDSFIFFFIIIWMRYLNDDQLMDRDILSSHEDSYVKKNRGYK
jgi:hypothetical protein